MSWIVTCAAWVQQHMEKGLTLLHRIRRNLLVPLAHWGGRDMALLTNGQWMDRTQALLDDQYTWVYSAERHALVWKGDLEGRTKRWSWLSVSLGDRDLSDFFQGLRVSICDHGISEDEVVALFAHQQGWMPRGILSVVRRDGTEEQVEIDAQGRCRRCAEETETPAGETSVDRVNHIQ